VVLVHSVRTWPNWPTATRSEALDNAQLYYVPTVTREPFPTPERGGDLFARACCRSVSACRADPEQEPRDDLGNPAMTRELTPLPQGLRPGH